jgi:hypothetical protein
MGYKYKKINRTKYLKNLSLKTQSKKIYGGDINEKITASFNSNMEKIENLVVSAIAAVVANSIQSIGTHIGVDPNKPASESIKELNDTMTKIVDALNTPEGENLKREIGVLIADSFDIIKPSIAEGEQIFIDGINKVSKTLKEIIGIAIDEIPIIFALTEFSKFTTAASQTGESVAKLTTTGINLFNNLQDNKDKGIVLWNKITNLLGDIANGVNNNVDKMVTLGQNKIDNLQNKIDNLVPNTNDLKTNFQNNLQNNLQNSLQNSLPNTNDLKTNLQNNLQNSLQNSLPNTNDLKTNFQNNLKNNLQNSLQNSLPNTNYLQNDLQQGGADLKKMYKEKMIIGGRIQKSLLEFLYKEKSQTKKNNYMRKLRSRKR